jgi:hypothetical protein
MTLFDRIVLLMTGLTAIYVIVRFIQDYRREGAKPSYDIYYITSFIVLLVAGLLLIANGYGVLSNPLVVIVAYLIPFCLAMGLVAEFYPGAAKGYLVFGIIGLIAIAVTRYTNAGGWATVVLAVWHSVAGLLIFFLPMLIVKAGRAPGGFIWVSIGGFLIGVGGISLAFLKAGAPILSADIIFKILAPILLLMALSFTWGFVKKMLAYKHEG